MMVKKRIRMLKDVLFDQVMGNSLIVSGSPLKSKEYIKQKGEKFKRKRDHFLSNSKNMKSRYLDRDMFRKERNVKFESTIPQCLHKYFQNSKYATIFRLYLSLFLHENFKRASFLICQSETFLKCKLLAYCMYSLVKVPLSNS